jgi:pyruvate kinase
MFPGVKVDLPTLTEKDVSDLVDFGVKHNVDFIAVRVANRTADTENILCVWPIGRHTLRIYCACGQ